MRPIAREMLSGPEGKYVISIHFTCRRNVFWEGGRGVLSSEREGEQGAPFGARKNRPPWKPRVGDVLSVLVSRDLCLLV